ncbi:protein Z-dependent protease inhibitor [Gouania willdenowi]|uniref:Protein Z-dependent protease inhibitor-like n=1 Tax=Gouania willdenowi TaxID=441366 RepID=A0A8C5DXJ8_GOUWI|nr:protein Z-dependent protease inhibitor-like [Gouania willdenowi]
MIFSVVITYFCLLAPFARAQNPSPTIHDLSLKNMDFAMDLYRRIASYHDKNIFFSPLSISTSFATLLMASDGITHDEIVKSFNLEQLERTERPEVIPELFQLLDENITQNGSLKLDQSMALFMHPEFKVEKTFEENLKKYFDADIKSVDFSDSEGSKSLINAYIKHQTKDKVTDVSADVNEMTKLLLISTIFFQGNWKLPFNPNLTQNAPFHIDNYNIVQVPMMFKEDKFYTMEDIPLGARVLKLPYQEGVSMLILLPNKDKDYTEIDEEISAKRFLTWVDKLEKIKLEVNMPKFKIEESYSLHHILPDMGLISIFTSTANLTRLSKDKGIKVSEVLHKAVIEVDETGTTAAAATTTGIIPYSLPRTFTVNRPFFFFIYHEETKCLLFMGRVIDPTKP